MGISRLLRSALLSMMLIAIIQLAHAQDFIWQGQHHSKRIILQKYEYGDSASFVLRLPDQGMDSIALFFTGLGDSVRFWTKTDGYRLSAMISEDSLKLQGILEPSYGDSYSLELLRVDEVHPITFPQHPKAPYPYVVRELSFIGRETSLDYGGTLVLPKKKKGFPLVILISGTGQHDRDYQYSGHRFFWVLSDYLARQGIASIRMDDRGIGKTAGDFALATTQDFATDVEEVINHLVDSLGIKYSKLGLVGHSEGGVIATMVTATNPEVDFMVSLSGVGVSGLEILALQNAEILKAYGIEDPVFSNQMTLLNDLFQAVYESSDQEDLITPLTLTMENWKEKTVSTIIEAMKMTDGGDQNFLYRYKRQAESPWYRYMIKYQPEEYMSKITVPVLAINGDRDTNVPAEENIAGFEAHVKPELLTTKIYPNLNHMYQHCQTCSPQEIPTIEEVFSLEAMADLVNWIQGLPK